MTSHSGFGFGKLILCGEHAVVYGEPAIAFAVRRGTRATLTAHNGPTCITEGDVHPDLLAAVCDVCGPHGWRVTLHTELPIGRGMGSSAALAAALARAHASATNRCVANDDVYRAALPVERRFHGNPSGIDLACAVNGGGRWFVRGDPPRVEPLHMPKHTFVVMDTGVAGDTSVQVEKVSSAHPQNAHLLRAIGDTVRSCRDVLADADALGALLTENHKLLVQLGVSTPALDTLVEHALHHGAKGAKLAGAGGGGVAIALCEGQEEGEQVLAAMRTLGARSWLCEPQESAS